MNETTVATKAIAAAVEQIRIARQAGPSWRATHRARSTVLHTPFVTVEATATRSRDSRSARAASSVRSVSWHLQVRRIRLSGHERVRGQFTAGKLPMLRREPRRYARPMSRAFVRENDGGRGPAGRAGASRQLAPQFRDRAWPAADREPDRRARSRARSAEAQRRQGRTRARRSRAALLAATQSEREARGARDRSRSRSASACA